MIGYASLLKLTLTLLAILSSSAVLAQQRAQRPLGVVELFTSQGCSSCPPADRLLSDMVRGGDVVALAYHVDYWDYLGWKDTLATEETTKRQRDYAQALDSTVYTPQMVINGRTHFPGARGEEIESSLNAMAGTSDGLTVDITVSETADSVIIDTGSASGKAKAHVVLVYFTPRQAVEIKRGENDGKSIEYWNAVTDLQTIGMWDGKAQRFELPRSEVEKLGGGCAVLLQVMEEGVRPGPILGAAMVRPPQS